VAKIFLMVNMYREHVGILGNGVKKKDRRKLKKQEEIYGRKKKISTERLKTKNTTNY
jgi:deferrochelatase/peroxidase EfeB